jgi:uncharacterized protein involved in exopolysaccharide biosynthesis
MAIGAAWWVQVERGKQAVLSLEYDPSSLVALPGVNGPARREAAREFLQTQSLIITSRSVCEHAVDMLSSSPHGYKVDGSAARARLAIEICDRLKTNRVGESLVVEVSYVGESLEESKLVVDAVASAYVGRAVAGRGNEGLSPLVLAKELEVVDAELEGHDVALSTFLQANGITSFDEKQALYAVAARSLTEALTETRLRRLRAGTRLAQVELALAKQNPVDARLGDEGLSALRDRVRQLEAEQQKLALSSEGRHPRTAALQAELANARAQLESAVRGVESAVRAEAAALDKEERELQRTLDREAQAALALAKLRVEYARLQRSASRHDALRSALLENLKKPHAAESRQGWIVRVLNPARPARPLPIVAATLAFWLLGGATAFVRSRLGRTSMMADHGGGTLPRGRT